MANRVTIQDIADELGLSRNTVSKALNASEGIAADTRELVLQKAVEMGYKQFAYVQGIVSQGQAGAGTEAAMPAAPSGRTEVALLSTAFLAGPHFASLMLDAFQNQISQCGYTLNAHRVSPEDIERRTLPATFHAERVAAIVCVEMFDFAYDEMVCGLGIPTLFVDGPAGTHGEALPSDLLLMDNTTQVMRLVSDMLAHGVRRVGFIGNWEHCQSFFERYAAFRLALGMAGIPVDESHCIRQNYNDGMQEGLAALDALPDLFVCANDFVALDALQALRALGYDVPRDVMLAGFDDSAESRRSVPRLTTVHIHTQAMAYSAVQLLRTRMSEPSLDFRRVYTETDLHYRESAPLER